MFLSDDQIAVIAYHAHRGYNHVIGDPWIDPPWPGLPQWHKDAIRDGVRAARAGLTPRQMHENWLAHYEALGWKHGPVKDADEKTHPLLVPYDDVPPEHRAKNVLFREIVQLLARL